MSKRDQREEGRREGMSYAVRFLENHNDDVEALKFDVKARGAHNIPVGIDKADVDEFSERVKRSILDSVLVMSLLVLHDEFDFGTKRLNQFKARFNEKADCLQGNYTTWEDTLAILQDECGMQLSIRWNGEDPTKAGKGEKANDD